MALEAKLSQIARLDNKEQTVQLSSLIDEVVAGASIAGLRTIAQKILSDDVHVQVTKPVLTYLATAVKQLSDDHFYDIAVFLVTCIKQNASAQSYDEADFILRDGLFSYCVGCEEYTEAAQYLAGSNLESTTRVFTDLEKVDIYIKCAEAVLEVDEAIDAEIYVNKASALINAAASQSKSGEDAYGPVQLRFRVTYARVLDANRKFAEAAVRYYGLSTTTGYNVLQEDLLELLGKAVTCAILGKAGQQRSRVLGLLIKDERLADLDNTAKYTSHRVVLTKMHLEQILKRHELDLFVQALMPHQKAVAGDGYSILDKAVMEHNLIAIGRIYENICITEVATILGLEPEKAEKVAAAMITEGRLNACIDQTEGLLIFEGNSDALESWDRGIEAVCSEITDFVDNVQMVSTH